MMNKKILYGLLAFLFLSGCATFQQKEQEPNTCVYRTDYYDLGDYYYKDYEIEIISEPSGAKIEWDNEYIGTAPLKKIINGTVDGVGFLRSIVIKAYPVLPGQYVQTKLLDKEPLPKKIYFNLNLGPATPSIDVNINN